VTRAARAGAAAIVGLMAATFALSYGLRYGVHNQHTYLLRAVRRADPGLFARDWLVARTTDYHPGWSVLAGGLMATGHGPWLLAAGNALVLCAAALLVYTIARSLAGARAIPVLALVLGYTVFEAQHEVVGSVAVSALFTNYLVPANLGSLGLLAAVALHLRGRHLLAGLAAAAGGFFHANYLVLAPPVLLAVHLLAPRAPGWWRSAAASVGPSVAVLLVRLPELLAMSADPQAAAGRAVFMAVRSPHHYLPLSFLRDFAPFYAWQLAGLVALRLWAPPLEIAFLRLRALMTALFLAITGATLLTTVVTVPFVAQLYVWRLAPLAVLLAQTACACWLVRPEAWTRVAGRLPRAPSLAPTAAAAVGAVLLAIGAGRGLPGLAAEARALRLPLADDEKLYGWARTTARDALFAVPPDAHAFRLAAERAIVVDWKSTPVRPGEVLEWYRRLLLVSGRPIVRNLDEAANGYRTMGPRRIARLRSELGVDFVVLRQPFPRGRLPEYRVAFADRRFIAFDVSIHERPGGTPQPE
jgi:Domain of unknown function (DUF6798)